jgi:hypothetical protein
MRANGIEHVSHEEAYQPAVSGVRSRFPEDFKVKAPRGFVSAVSVGAQVRGTTGAEYVRQAFWAASKPPG